MHALREILIPHLFLVEQFFVGIDQRTSTLSIKQQINAEFIWDTITRVVNLFGKSASILPQIIAVDAFVLLHSLPLLTIHSAIAHIYHRSPSQVARGKFLKQLINDLQEENWLGLDLKKESGVKVMDYAAGTGILSHVSRTTLICAYSTVWKLTGDRPLLPTSPTFSRSTNPARW